MIVQKCYIFDPSTNDELDNYLRSVFVDVNKYHTHISRTQGLRLFDKVNFADSFYNVFEININADSANIVIENGVYIDDSLVSLHNVLEKFPSAIGSSSYKYNLILEKILWFSNDSLNILGEYGWNSLRDLFTTLYDCKADYVVLRKFEGLPDAFIENDHDLDILCASMKEIILITNAKKRNIGISSYYLEIEHHNVDLDIRFLGDCYFDPKWERDILLNKQIYSGVVYIPDKVNYLFMCMYHTLTQKSHIDDYYRNIMNDLIMEVSYFHLVDNCKYSVYILKILISFMRSKSYIYLRPLDISVIQNVSNIKHINISLQTISKSRNFKHRIYRHIPIRIRELIPSSITEKIYNMK